MENCLFCKIARGELPTEVIYEDDDAMAFRDVNPQAPSHVLVIPKKHIPSAVQIEDEDAGLLMHLFRVISEVSRLEDTWNTGIRILTNVGHDAGQDVLHLHFHVLGGRRMGWPPG